MLVVVVKRSQWGSGRGVTGSRLYNPETQKFCCMGFACLAAGLSKEAITNVPTIAGLARGMMVTQSGELPEALHQFLEEHDHGQDIHPAGWNIYGLNDNVELSGPVREEQIQLCGEKYGLAFTFED